MFTNISYLERLSRFMNRKTVSKVADLSGFTDQRSNYLVRLVVRYSRQRHVLDNQDSRLVFSRATYRYAP
jgi:hypothetical protein